MTPTPALVDTIRNLVADAASPAELADFDAELSAAGTDMQAVLARWAGRAALLADPLTPAEKEQLERFRRTGDVRGFLTRDGDGLWIRL
ncbi:hypothetical protein [Mycolicibacter virginiensis]|uniref:hypothetical protein n=1 Tax=Mycolicibacter virginiensis TaxID=1795032 RepID=UPI001F042C54|nr:hypothetical protein [Mycolicibacter virginiensis]ULP45904.1 hypothetical protein MJO54_13595 [Mycolicibacter virginiensis]